MTNDGRPINFSGEVDMVHGKTEILSEDADLSIVQQPMVLSPGAVIDGRYELGEEIGRGGMGSVFRGRHLTLNVPIAVKVMLPSVATNLEYARRFRREARAMSRLRHRNVAHVHDFGDVEGTPYMVIEFLQGESLADYLADFLLHDRFVSLRDLAEIFLQIVDGLEAAHLTGIIHRDLKPDNIFLARESDGQRVVKILDFGLARVVDAPEGDGNITEVGLIAGTPHYMSPEQCRSMDVGPGADIYSLGCVLTELLQGAPPFHNAPYADVLSRHLLVAPPEIARSPGAEALPAALEKFRLDLLAKTPEARPATMERVRTRFVDAMTSSAANTESRNSMPSGGRESRAPNWAEVSRSQISRTSERPNAPAVVLDRVTLVKLNDEPTDSQEGWKLGLELHEFRTNWQDIEDDPSAEGLIVLDCAHTDQAALDWLAKHPSAAPRTVVCGSGVVAALPRLVAAGVGDVLSYPVDATALVRKLTRLSLEHSIND